MRVLTLDGKLLEQGHLEYSRYPDGTGGVDWSWWGRMGGSLCACVCDAFDDYDDRDDCCARAADQDISEHGDRDRGVRQCGEAMVGLETGKWQSTPAQRKENMEMDLHIDGGQGAVRDGAADSTCQGKARVQRKARLGRLGLLDSSHCECEGGWDGGEKGRYTKRGSGVRMAKNEFRQNREIKSRSGRKEREGGRGEEGGNEKGTVLIFCEALFFPLCFFTFLFHLLVYFVVKFYSAARCFAPSFPKGHRCCAACRLSMVIPLCAP